MRTETEPLSPELSAIASAAADSWVTRLLGELEDQRRPASGGWPGTISEARQLVATRLTTEQPQTVDRSTFDNLVRQTYERARRSWTSQATRTPPD